MPKEQNLPAGPWKDLADAHGGVPQLAAELGVDPWTIYRWARGEFKPRAMVQKMVNAIAKRRRCTPPFPGA